MSRELRLLFQEVIASCSIIFGIIWIISLILTNSAVWQVFWPLLLFVPGNSMLLHTILVRRLPKRYYFQFFGSALCCSSIVFFTQNLIGQRFAVYTPLTLQAIMLVLGILLLPRNRITRFGALLLSMLLFIELADLTDNSNLIIPVIMIVLGFVLVRTTMRRNTA